MTCQARLQATVVRHCTRCPDGDATAREWPLRRTPITGMAGVGKSTVIDLLRQRGHKAVHLDTPEWFVCGYLNHDQANDA